MGRQGLMVFTLGLALMTVGCSPPTLDSSSDEALKASVEEVRQSLPEERRSEFDEAMMVLAFSEIDLGGLIAAGAAGVEDVPDTTTPRIKDRLDGLTGEEVIAEAEEIRRAQREKEREQALQEIGELEAKQAEAERAGEMLERFEVVRSRFSKRPQRFGGPQPVIELTVRNGTDEAISRAYFEGTLASPGRSVPWLREDFNHSISGGLEPGEEATWSLSPNMFSEWGRVDAPSDAVFTVEVVRLDGADGEALWDSEGLSEWEAERLESLRAQVQETE